MGRQAISDSQVETALTHTNQYFLLGPYRFVCVCPLICLGCNFCDGSGTDHWAQILGPKLRKVVLKLLWSYNENLLLFTKRFIFAQDIFRIISICFTETTQNWSEIRTLTSSDFHWYFTDICRKHKFISFLWQKQRRSDLGPDRHTSTCVDQIHSYNRKHDQQVSNK